MSTTQNRPKAAWTIDIYPSSYALIDRGGASYVTVVVTPSTPTLLFLRLSPRSRYPAFNAGKRGSLTVSTDLFRIFLTMYKIEGLAAEERSYSD